VQERSDSRLSRRLSIGLWLLFGVTAWTGVAYLLYLLVMQFAA
jgi:hypothetical protein